MPELIVKVIGDTSALERSFARAGRKTRGFGHDIEGASRGAAAATLSFRGLGRTLAFASGGFLTGAAAVSAIRGAFAELGESQKVAAQTAAVLRSTGGVAGVTAKQVDSLATALLNKSGVDDEAIKSGENLLLTFTKIRNQAGVGNDIFTQATKGALDLSVALGSDVKSAALQVGKALQDPVRGVTALRRAGVSFTAGQQKLIKSLVDSGHSLDAQKLILRELTKEFGGSAAALGKTLPGQLSILKNDVSNLGAEIAQVLTPSIEEVVQKATKWIQNSENQQRVLNDVRATVKATSVVVGHAANAWDRFAEAVGGTREALEALATFFLLSKISGRFGESGEAASHAASSIDPFNSKLKSAGAALTAVAVLKLPAFSRGLSNAGVAATAAAGTFARLGASLGRLAKFGIITVGINLLLNGNRFNKDDKWDKKGILQALNPLNFGRDIQAALGGHDAREKAIAAGPGWKAFFDSITNLAQSTAAPLAQQRLKSQPKLKGAFMQGRALTPVEQASIALAGNPDDVAANKVVRAAKQRALDFALKQIAAEKGNTKKFAQAAERLTGDIAAINLRLAGVAQEAAQKAKDARDKVKAARAKAKAAHLAFIADLQGQLGDFSDLGVKGGPLTIQAINRSIAKDQARLRQVAQFKALGLTGTGDALAPTRRALLAELGKTQKGLAGTILDTDANRNLIGRIRKVLSREFGALTRETKLKVKELLDALQGDKHGPLTATSAASIGKLISGTGLKGAGLKRLELNLAGAHLTTRPIHVHTTIEMDGREVARNTTVHQRKDAQRTPTQTRGRQAR